ncbi:MAG: PAS domain S-box protein [Promethearchaeota archaeon]
MICDNMDDKVKLDLSFEQIRVIFNHTPVILVQWKGDGSGIPKFITHNISRFGYLPEDLYSGSVTFIDLVHPDDIERVKTEFENYISTQFMEYTQKYRILTRTGETRWIEDHTSTFRNSQNKIESRYSLIKDITERHLAEESIQEDELKFKEIVQKMPIGVMLLDMDENITYINPVFIKIFGYTKKEITTHKEWMEKVYPDKNYRSKIRELWMQDKKSTNQENQIARHLRIRNKSNTLKNIIASPYPLGTNQYIIFFNDITTEFQAKESLSNEKERLNVTLESIGEGIIVTDETGKIILFNSMAEILSGWKKKDARGKQINEILNLSFNSDNNNGIETFSDKSDKKQSFLYFCLFLKSHQNFDLISNDGQRYLISIKESVLEKGKNVLGSVFVIQDITEKHRIEEELLKNQKIESVGKLAGGIAHDFNNILTSILGNLSIANMDLDEDVLNLNEIKEILSDAEKATLRAKDLTNQLLTFSKGGAPILETTSIIDILQDTVKFALRGTNVKAELDFPENPWSVDVDKGQISQVFNNITINAVQAMPKGGLLTFQVENVKEPLLLNQPKNKSQFLKISISDTGCGISPENLIKIFDPYFTTKSDGNGLGLAVCYSIIKNHGGKITVESKINYGTTFSIYLPASNKKTSMESTSEKKQLKSGSGKILIMDDEPEIQLMLDKILHKLGFSAHFVNNGYDVIEAYNRARRKNEAYDLTILDLTIPGGMGAKEVMSILLREDHNIRAVISSGYVNHPVIQNYQDYGFVETLIKPFTLNELSEMLERILK